MVPLLLLSSSGFAQSIDYSLRFHGNGQNDIDRVKISIDAPEVPADVGDDFTLEFRMKANPGENAAGNCSPGNDNWITGNIIFDRDVFGAGDNGDYGISLFSDGLAFGVNNGATGAGLCGSTNVADGQWHHVAVTRRSSDGLMSLYVDGQLEAQSDGPDGDVSYRDGRTTSYPDSDPFLVIGAEKHDAGSSFPSFSGWVDEVRLSNTIRYLESFVPPSQPFLADGNTVALYHFDEGTGDIINDASGAPGGPSDGTRRFGGSPAGPEWSTDTPFNDPVPIELASFVAHVASAGHVLLEWQTLSETINFGFEVQRKSRPSGEFNTLPNSFIPGHGTTTTPQSYTFLDSTVSPGRWGYRLKQIDLDGSITFHEEIEVEIDLDLTLPATFALHQNYPNPFNAGTFIEFRLLRPAEVVLKIFDLTGKEVRTILHESRNSGLHHVKWTGENNSNEQVASGTYIYRLTAGNLSQTRRMLRVKSGKFSRKQIE